MKGLTAAFLLLAVSLVTWIGAVPTWGGPGLSWDEAYYYPTFEDAAAWAGAAGADPVGALSEESLREGWESINELPPMVKWLGALSLAWAPPEGWGRLAALRVIPAVAFGATVMMLFLLGLRLGGRAGAWIAPALYLSLPRVAGHAQLAATETVFTLMTMLVLWAALGNLGRWRWRLVLAGALGLALATKVNGLILAVAIVAWLVARRPLAGRGAPSRTDLASLALLPLALPVAFAVWPWMWADPLAHLHGYLRFILEHAHQGVWFLGERRNFIGDPAPVTYPLVMAHVTTPVVHLAVFWAAAGLLLLRTARRRRLDPAALLLLLAVLGPFSASSLPNAPKYDGVRLFLPMFAPACLLVARVLGPAFHGRLGGIRLLLPPWLVGGGVMLVALGVNALRVPSIDHYNLPTKVLSEDMNMFPFEQTYWMTALRPEVIDDLNILLRPGSRVRPMAMQAAVFPLLEEWGLLTGGQRFDTDPPYDAHLVQNRKGFWGNAEWSLYLDRIPIGEWGKGQNGESLILLYDGRPPGSPGN